MRLSTLSFLAIGACGGRVVVDGGSQFDGGVQPSPSCPQSGGSMIEVMDLFGGSYCIDQTEVTNAAYAGWLATSPGDELRTMDCRSDGRICQGPSFAGASACHFGDGSADSGAAFFSYEPLALGRDDPAVWPVSREDDGFPVVNVSWCDASAFCAGNGKRLCGRIGGGAFVAPPPTPSFDFQSPPAEEDDSQVIDPARAEIANAATRSGALSFPYGDTFQPTACPGAAIEYNGVGGDLHATGRPSCEGGFPGLFDLVGNAMEYIDALTAFDGTTRSGIAVGPARVDADPPGLSVAMQVYLPDPVIGFRCCADTMPP